MFSLSGYLINEKIIENNRSCLYRGYAVFEQLPVLIKVLKTERDSAEAKKLIHEFEITRSLECQGIVIPKSLEWGGEYLALIIPDNGAQSLREFTEDNKVSLPEFFSLAVQLTRILEELHHSGIVHGSLSPDNILIQPETKGIQICDFSCARLLTGNNTEPSVSDDFLMGNLAYLAPEQTGRTGYFQDKRSDLYSLGVIFYELLTGKLPFDAGESIEWVHAHLTQLPVPPDGLNSKIPPLLSALIMKLLAKNPAERYQHASSLQTDLSECGRRWAQTGTIQPFSLGQTDFFDTLRLSPKLYGREREQEIIREAMVMAEVGHAVCVMVAGQAGIGKTALVQEAITNLQRSACYYISGKFEQFQLHKPYAPLGQAFGRLIRKIMTESPDRLEIWKKKITQVLGSSGAAITGIVPEVEMLIGPQPPLETLQPKETKNRLHLLFSNFVRVFAQKDHPLIIFLDDLQWADLASLQLLQGLSTDPDGGYCLFIGAYRNNEIHEGHPLPAILSGLEKTKVKLVPVFLDPLAADDVYQLIADSLSSEPEQTRSLAEILQAKSGGNPFFLRELLKYITQEKLLTFNEQKRCWQWQLSAVEELPIPDDLLGLMLEELHSQPEETLNILKLAALIGNPFGLAALTVLSGKTRQAIAGLLRPALLEGLIFPVEQAVQDTDQASLTNDLSDASYKFLHDRVQQAAYALWDTEEKQAIHLQIGRLLADSIEQNKLDDTLFKLVNHYNQSLVLIDDPAERLKLAEYNLLAGLKAKSTAAYNAALEYYRTGLQLLPDKAWTELFELSYALHLECFQAEYICGDLQTAREQYQLLQGKTRDKTEKAALYALLVRLESSKGRYKEAVLTGLEALASLGVKFPSKAGKINFFQEIILVKWRLKGKKPLDLVNWPAMNDKFQKNLLELLTVLAAALNPIDPQLYALTVLKAGNLSVKYGNTYFSPMGYIGFSIVMGSVQGDYATGRQFEQAALQLTDQNKNSATSCLVHFATGACVSHWTQHGRQSLNYMEKAMEEGKQAGETNFVGLSAAYGLETKCFLGVSLPEIYEDCLKYRKLAKQIEHRTLLMNTLILEHLSTKLMGIINTVNAPELKNEEAEYSEEYFKKISGNILAAYYLAELQLAYFSGEYLTALAIADKSQELMHWHGKKGYLNAADYLFYQSLAITAAYQDLASEKKRKYRAIVKNDQKRLKEWAKHCPQNFLHKYLTVEAELARLAGKHLHAQNLWDQAGKSAQENGYIQNEAIACELAGKYYLIQKRDKIARMYLSEAWSAYVRWGAIVKAKALQEQYPALLADMTREEKIRSQEVYRDKLPEQSPGGGSNMDSSDLSTIKRVVQTLEEDSPPETMLKTFLAIAMENAGANRGFLILEQVGELFIEAFQEIDGEPDEAKTPLLLGKSSHLSRDVVRYVARTLETVVLNPPQQTGIFNRDPYFNTSSAQSVVCLPVLFQGIQAGVLYLENTLLPGVFVPERLEVLKLISTQMIYVNRLRTFLGPDIPKYRDFASLPKVPLTERELEVIRLLSEGLSNKEIAQRLMVSLSTVKTHILNIYGKLQVSRRVQAVTMAKELNIL